MANISSGPYDVGDHVKVTANIKVDDVFTDAASVTAKYMDSDGVTTVVSSISHAGTGIYVFLIPLTKSGTWRYRVESDSPFCAEENSFCVRVQEVF